MGYLMPSLFIKNLLIGYTHEDIKPSSPHEAQKFGKMLLKRGNYGKIFKKCAEKLQQLILLQIDEKEVFCGGIIIAKCTYLGILGTHRDKKLEKWVMDV